MNKKTIDNMKNQIKVNKDQKEIVRERIMNKKSRPFYLIPVTCCLLLAIIFTYTSLNYPITKKKELSSFSILAYAEEFENGVILEKNIEMKLGTYSKAMSSVPGFPFEFKTNNFNEDEYLLIKIDNGELLEWEGIQVTRLGNNYVIDSNKTIYVSPEQTCILKITHIKNNSIVEIIYVDIIENNFVFTAKMR